MKTVLKVLSDIKSLVIFLIITCLLTYFYYLALTQTVSWQSFLNSNTTTFIILQISLSIINALLASLSIVFIYRIFRDRKNQGDLTFVQTVGALFFSIITTGCYVCGTILLPSIGIASSFATLPFGGLEVKILTVLFLIYTLYQLIKKYKGICEIESSKSYIVQFGKTSFRFRVKYFQRVKPLIITASFVLLVFSLPFLLPSNGNEVNHSPNSMCDGINCSCNINN